MSGTLFRESGGGFRVWAAGGVLFAALFAAASRAEPVPDSAPAPAAPAANPAAAPAGDVDGSVIPAGCASCSGGVLGLPPSDLDEGGGCASCGCGGNGCVPGRRPCDCCCDACDGPGRFVCGIYQCICCPDPCYEPHWTALADSSFFQTTGPRPITQMRLRYDEGWNMPFPDKSEFFMPRSDGPKGKGPPQTVPAIFDGNLATFREGHMYTEAAIGRFSTWIDMPYRDVSFKEYDGHSGFGDLSIGTKSMLLDCELLQFTFEMNTFTPTGNFTRGLGTGHLSLEPGLLAALKLLPETYLQSEIAYRFPLGGDQAFEGAVFHYHLSLNQLLWHCGHDIQLIGTAEFNGWEFLGGQFTGPGDTPAANVDLAVSGSPVADVFNLGPGARLVICDKIDFGVAAYFNVSSGSIAKEYLDAEFRWRF